MDCPHLKHIRVFRLETTLKIAAPQCNWVYVAVGRRTPGRRRGHLQAEAIHERDGNPPNAPPIPKVFGPGRRRSREVLVGP